MAVSGITSQYFGKTADGQEITKFTLRNNNQLQVDVIDFGGIITSVVVPDAQGSLADITTGFDTVAEYEENPPYFGALIGRVANRIQKGQFSLDGKDYQLAINNGPNHLHGGRIGFDKKVWKSSIKDKQLHLELESPDGEENYPGAVTVTVVYELTEENELVIEYRAVTTQATPINLTNHAYFNLAGHDAGSIQDHLLTVFADNYTPKDGDDIPTGEFASVKGSLFDFLEPVRLGDRLSDIPGGKPGLDHNFCINGTGDKKLAARVVNSGRVLEVYTNEPGVQIYTGNYLEGVRGKNSAVYNMHCCIALETQNYPDAINKPEFPSCVLRPGSTYHHKTWFKFSTTA